MKNCGGGGGRGVTEYEYKMSPKKKCDTYTKYFKSIG